MSQTHCFASRKCLFLWLFFFFLFPIPRLSVWLVYCVSLATFALVFVCFRPRLPRDESYGEWSGFFFLILWARLQFGLTKSMRGCSAQWLHESCSQQEVGPRFKKISSKELFLCWPIVLSSSILSCSEHLDPDMGYDISGYNIPQDFYTEFQYTIYNGTSSPPSFFFPFLPKSATYSVQVKAQYDFTSHFIKPLATFWIYDALCLMSSDCCRTWHICNQKKSDRMFLSRKIGSIGPPSTFGGAAVAQVDPVVQPLPTHPTSQWFRPFRSCRWADATVLTGGKIAVSQSETQARRPWWQRRLSWWLTAMTDGRRGDEWHHPESNLADGHRYGGVASASQTTLTAGWSVDGCGPWCKAAVLFPWYSPPWHFFFLSDGLSPHHHPLVIRNAERWSNTC